MSRPSQRTPGGEWYVWLILAGRGWGKTRTGAEDLAHYALAHPRSRLAVVAPTFADARDTCVEGESGLLAVVPPPLVREWNRSLGELVVANGSRFKLFSADEPNRLRGPQHHRAWGDEVAAWAYPEALDQLFFGLRLGERPQAVLTTTPKPVPIIRDLLTRDDVQVTRGSTFENAANLAPAALAALRARYEGTRLGRQELNAELLEDAEGALWQRAVLDATRVTQLPALTRVVVGVDPEATSGEGAAETGIVVAGLGQDGDGYVLDDASLRGTPHEWARAAVAAYHRHRANLLVAETNQGGEMVQQTIRTVDPQVAYKGVHASRSKQARAEPVAALWEQGRCHMVGSFAALEDQLCGWVPGSGPSPDRLDALVWALTDLLLAGTWNWGGVY